MTKEAFRGWTFLASLILMVAGGFAIDAGFEAGGTTTLAVGVIVFLAALYSAQDQPA